MDEKLSFVAEILLAGLAFVELAGTYHLLLLAMKLDQMNLKRLLTGKIHITCSTKMLNVYFCFTIPVSFSMLLNNMLL